MLVTWPFVMLLLDYWPLQRLQLNTQPSKLRTLLPLLREKVPFFALAALASVVTFVVQQHGGSLGAVENLPLSARWRERPDFLLPPPGEAVLANGTGGLLSAPRVLAAGEGAAGGGRDPGPFGAALGAAAAVSLFADGVAVVCRDAGARDRTGADGRTGDGGSAYLSAVPWGADSGDLGRVRTDPALAVSGAGRWRWRVVRRSSSAWR